MGVSLPRQSLSIPKFKVHSERARGTGPVEQPFEGFPDPSLQALGGTLAWRHEIAISSVSRARSAGREVDTRHPTIGRLKASVTKAT